MHALFKRRTFSFKIALLSAVALMPAADMAFAQSRRIENPNAQAKPAEQPAPPKADKQFPAGAAWIAVTVNGRPVIGERPSVLIDDNFRARGFGGCNTFSATAYPLRGQGFAVGPVASTRKACDKAVMDQERAFFVAFRSAQNWDTQEGAFLLKGPNGELRFERSF